MLNLPGWTRVGNAGVLLVLPTESETAVRWARGTEGVAKGNGTVEWDRLTA